MMKSKDGITYFIKKMKSGNRYIKLRASVEINGNEHRQSYKKRRVEKAKNWL